MIRLYLQFSYVLLIYFLVFQTSQADDIGVYWGQNGSEGSLAATCATGKYSIVKVAYLGTFGNYTPPEINLIDHCQPSSNGCTVVSPDIKYCQRLGIKVTLSIGGRFGNYILTSPEDAKSVSEYLWNNFLGGNSSSRPLGGAILDAIDFVPRTDIMQSGYSGFWEDLARYLKSYTTHNVYVSAAPPCPESLNSLFNNSLFDYLSVQFYNNAHCNYEDGSTDGLINSWNQWNKLKVEKIFLELPASSDAATSGFSPVDVLVSQILPIVRKSPKYEGVMLWSRYEDQISGYSDSIKLNAGSRKHHAVIWIATSVGAALAITSTCYLSCVFWRKYKAEVDTRKRQKELIHDIGGTAMLSRMNYTAQKIKKEGNTSNEIEIFNFESMVAAINNFSASNKLGEGGFGPVYMGRLTNQQEIAIKRLSRSSGQGLTEFKNEVKLIAKLQHTNLVRLIGLCIQREERMLVYEYMLNGSLDFHLFEYALTGIVSTKIDVFSFGVLLLEILSGKKNNSSYDPDSLLNLIGYAWKLWNEGRALQLMDPRLNETCTPNEVLRCMQIGLLCVQDHTADRPTMLDVVSFLSNDAIQLAQPKQPAFFVNADTNRSELPNNRQERYSTNNVTVSVTDGR